MFPRNLRSSTIMDMIQEGKEVCNFVGLNTWKGITGISLQGKKLFCLHWEMNMDITSGSRKVNRISD